MAIGQFAGHYFSIPGMVYGTIEGAGFGVLLLAIISKKPKMSYN